MADAVRLCLFRQDRSLPSADESWRSDTLSGHIRLRRISVPTELESDLNSAIARNIERFPDDFMFRLTREEFNDLKFHFGISSWGGTRKLPRAFTEQGVAMLSGVLRSPRAVQVNIQIMRTFVKLRRMLSAHKELEGRLDALERKYDKRFRAVFEAIRQLMKPPQPKRRRIGFQR